MIHHKIVMVTSPKGYEGKTSISAALALQYAKNGHTTSMVELDRYLASSPLMLGVKNMMNRSLSKAVKSDTDNDIATNFIPVPKTNNLYLMALNNVEVDFNINGLYEFPLQRVQEIIKFTRSNNNVTILDCPSTYHENGFLAPFDVGVDHLIYVIDDNPMKLAGLKMYDRELTEMGIDFGTVSIVVNRYMGILDPKDIQEIVRQLKTLKTDVVKYIPYIKKMPEHSTTGVTLLDAVGGFKASAAKKVIMELTNKLTEGGNADDE